jgi:hypothetical protein
MSADTLAPGPVAVARILHAIAPCMQFFDLPQPA